jgi:hypothetical protein
MTAASPVSRPLVRSSAVAKGFRVSSLDGFRDAEGVVISARGTRSSEHVLTMTENANNIGKSLRNRGSATSAWPASRGRESAEKVSGKIPDSHSSATESATRDRRLDLILASWDQLPEAVRAGIAALVCAASDGAVK